MTMLQNGHVIEYKPMALLQNGHVIEYKPMALLQNDLDLDSSTNDIAAKWSCY